jgi:hypothetical protein
VEEVSVNFEDEQELSDALVYVCGLLEELVEAEVLTFAGPGAVKNEGALLNPSGEDIYNDLKERGYTLTTKDAILTTIAIIEAQKARIVAENLFDYTLMNVHGDDSEPN